MVPWVPADVGRGRASGGLPPGFLVLSHQFYLYEVAARRLTLVQEVTTSYLRSNSGKWLPVSSDHPVFVNNPSMNEFYAWEGDILGGAELTLHALPGTHSRELGYLGSSYTMIPNPLQGSVASPGTAWLMSDLFNPGKPEEERGPCSLLLWRLSLSQ